jgi:hypothetical protein
MTGQIDHKCIKQSAMNVVEIAKYLLDQVVVNQFIVVIVLKVKEEMIEEVAEEMTGDLVEEMTGDLVEEMIEDLVDVILVEEIQEELLCIVRYVMNVVKIVKYLLDQQVENQSIVAIVLMVKMIKVIEEVEVEIIEIIEIVMAEKNQANSSKC